MNIKDFAEKIIYGYHEALEKGNTTPLKALEDPKVVYHLGARGDFIGPDAHEKDFLTLRMVVSDARIDMKLLASDGNLLVFSLKQFYVFNGKLPGSPPAGTKTNIDSLCAFQLKNGKIIEMWLQGQSTSANT